MQPTDKVYISGHRGLVGSAIVRTLQEKGFSNLLLRTHQELDLTDQQQVFRFFESERPDYIFHAAGKVGGIHANNTYPAEYIYDNLIIAANVIHAAHLNIAKKLLFLGSSCIYPKLCPQPIKEEYLLTGELEPTNEAYALAKIAGMKLVQHYRTQYGSDFISAMPTNLYGVNDHFHPANSHVLPALIRKLHLAKCLWNNDKEAIVKDLSRDNQIEPDQSPEDALEKFGIRGSEGSVTLTLWGSGSPYREFMFVDDLAEALVFLMNTYSATEPVNIGTGEDITILELATLIQGIVGYEGDIAWDTSKPDGTPRKQLDISRLTSLGFKSATTLPEGLRKTYQWYLNC